MRPPASLGFFLFFSLLAGLSLAQDDAVNEPPPNFIPPPPPNFIPPSPPAGNTPGQASPQDQNPPNLGNPPVTPTPRAGTAPGAGTVRPGATGAATVVIEGDSVKLQFPNNSIQEILSMYETLTGKAIVKETEIFTGPTISLSTPGTVSKDEAIRLIEASLLLNGYALIAAPGGKSLKVLQTRGQGNQPKPSVTDSIMLYQAADTIPNSETVIAFFMKLQNLDPTRASEIFANQVGLHPFGKITPVENPPGLLITETASIVRHLVNIKELIDVKADGTGMITRFIELEYADASIVAQVLQASLEARKTEQQKVTGKTLTGNTGNPANPNAPQPMANINMANVNNAANAGRLTPSGYVAGTQIFADDRLNRIVIVASEEEMVYLISMAREFDQPLKDRKPYERRLYYTQPVDLLPVLVDALKPTGQGQQRLANGQSINTQQQNNAGTSAASLTGRGNNTNRSNLVENASSTDTVGGADRIREDEETITPLSVLAGKTRIIADPQNSAILAIGTDEDLQKIDDLLDKMDQKPLQVYISAIIGQLTLGDNNERGVDILQKVISERNGGQLTAGSFFNNDAVRAAVGDQRDNLLTSAVGAAAGFNVYAKLGDAADIFVTALESSNRFKVLARPTLYTLNNRKAVITSGQRIPVPRSSLTNASSVDNNNNGNVTTDIEFENVVLKVEVLPRINDKGEITLTLAQTNDSVVGTQQVANNEVPIIGTQQLTTTVTVPNRSTAVLGGLINEDETLNESGVPGLRKIPVLGNLFKKKTKMLNRRELIIFIQPTVVRNNTDLARASRREDERTDVGADAAERFPTEPLSRQARQAREAADKAVKAKVKTTTTKKVTTVKGK